MPYKVTFLFNANAQGWSETFYTQTVTANPTSQVLDPNVQLLGNSLLACSAYPTNWVGTRISQIGTPRSTILVAKNNTVKENAGNDAQYVTSCALANLKGPNGAGSRQLWLHGIGKNQMNFDPTQNAWTFGGPLQTAWSNLRDVLLSGNWYLRTINPALNDATLTLILSGQLGVQANAVVLNPTINKVPAGANIIVSGFKWPLQHLNGTYTYPLGCNTAAAQILLFNRSLSTTQIAGYGGGGLVRAQVVSYTNKIASANLEFVRERRVGRAFFVPRGRKSSR
jgi:hypothetical protein